MVRGLPILSTGTHCHQKNDRGLDALDMGLSNQPQSPSLTAEPAGTTRRNFIIQVNKGSLSTSLLPLKSWRGVNLGISSTVQSWGKIQTLPMASVSIFPDCRNTNSRIQFV